MMTRLARALRRAWRPCRCKTCRRPLPNWSASWCSSASKGAMINDHVNGRTLDEPEFSAVLEGRGATGRPHPVPPGRRDGCHATYQALPPAQYHRQPGGPHGNLCHPGLRRGHGRLPRSQDLPVARWRLHLLRHRSYGPQLADPPGGAAAYHPTPSAYLRRFYYDCIVYTEAALRYLIDTVGIDRVVFGTDWPYDMAFDWPVSWILSLREPDPGRKRRHPVEEPGTLTGTNIVVCYG